MKIGVLHTEPHTSGGIYQYSLALIDSLVNADVAKEIIIFTANNELEENRVGKGQIVRLKTNKILSYFVNIFSLLGLKYNYCQYREISDCNLDLLICPFPSLVGYALGIPYVVCIHDLMHKYYPKFPEYPLLERIKRDLFYAKAARHALISVVDSSGCKKDLVRFYSIDENRIRAIPFTPPPYINKYRDMSIEIADKVLARYSLPEKYIFYPAQFWSHKNHLRLVNAVYFINYKYKCKINVVFVGAKKESFDRLFSHVKRLKLDDQIFYLGYISQQEMVALYKKATALVFPSLLGHTNIPPLEAMTLGTPVLCSNLFSMPEQVQDAGVLFDPFDVEDIAAKILLVWQNDRLRAEMIAKGKEIAKHISPDSFALKWRVLIQEAMQLKKNQC
jgi:glycosyltransferase involved in cell wall biosynthesis